MVAPPLSVMACAPLVAQLRVNDASVTVTGSLKVTLTLLFTATSVALFAGVVLTTRGATSPSVVVREPNPSRVLTAKPFHSVAGSKASVALVSPARMVGLRRSVLSAVLVSPVPHSVPGSTPTWPIESMTAPALRRTMASSPFQLIVPPLTV